MKFWVGALIGATIGVYLALLAGVALGGLFQIAPCHGGAASRSVAERISYGAMFGLYLAGTFLALPAAVAGALVGVVVTAKRQRR
jgi:hypothetical protein